VCTPNRKALWLAFLFSPALVGGQVSPPPGSAVGQESVKEIVRRGMEEDLRNYQLERDYTYQQREEVKVLDKKGRVKKRKVRTHDLTYLYGEPYLRLIQKDDKPVSAKDEAKEAEKLDHFVAERRNESEKEHQKRLAKQEKERQEDRAFDRDILNAYDFRLAGDDRVDGHDVYVVAAEPRKDFHPTQPHADILPKLRGRVWIDKENFGWVKLEAETLGTISWGVVLVRIQKGTEVKLEQCRVNDEIWLPRRITLNANARVALLLSGVVDYDLSFSNYKKFTSAARVLPGAIEAKPASAPPP